MEEVRMNCVTTADPSAVAKPDRIAITVYAIVVCDFLFGADLTALLRRDVS
jgi:hypothetical protein